MPNLRSIKRIYEANPNVIASWIITERVWIHLKSLTMAYLLKAPGIYLGSRCRIIGGRHIRFGRGMRAQGGLWMEAITNFGPQRFTPDITIGESVYFSYGVHISAIEQISIGNHVLMGSHIYISDHNHGVYKGDGQSSPEEEPSHRKLGGGGPVTIGENVWIGDNSVILGPAAIGNGAIIGANSIVRGTVETNSIVAGAPARLIKRFNPKTGCWERA